MNGRLLVIQNERTHKWQLVQVIDEVERTTKLVTELDTEQEAEADYRRRIKEPLTTDEEE